MKANGVSCNEGSRGSGAESKQRLEQTPPPAKPSLLTPISSSFERENCTERSDSHVMKSPYSFIDYDIGTTLGDPLLSRGNDVVYVSVPFQCVTPGPDQESPYLNNALQRFFPVKEVHPKNQKKHPRGY